MKLRMLIAVAALATTGTAMADSAVVRDGYQFFSEQLIPSGARLEVGTAGYGGALLWTASPMLEIVLGYNGGDVSWSDDLKINGSKYDLDMENNNVYLNVQMRPWSNWFYLAAGVAYIDNDYDLDRRVSAGGGFTVNNVDFVADSNVKIAGKMQYENKISPYLGLGFAPALNKRWGVFGEIGAYYTDNPDVKLALVSGSANDNPTGGSLEDALKNEENKIGNANKYEWLPVAKVGVSFNF